MEADNFFTVIKQKNLKKILQVRIYKCSKKRENSLNEVSFKKSSQEYVREKSFFISTQNVRERMWNFFRGKVERDF